MKGRYQLGQPGARGGQQQKQSRGSSSSHCTRAARQAEGSHFQGNTRALPQGRLQHTQNNELPQTLEYLDSSKQVLKASLWILLMEKIDGANGKIHQF